MSSKERIICIGYRVPKKVPTSFQGKATLKLQLDTEREVLWVGYCGSSSPENTPKEGTVSDENVFPVYIDPETAKAHFSEFCKRVLWPMFHYCEDVEGRYSASSWEAYQKVNQLFAAATISCYRPGDIILVQGYHLLLLPSLLRKQLPEVKIGFFLHIPWPSSEIYRALPVRNELLMGLIEADLIGFQTYAYSRHFFSAVTRLLGYTCDEKGVRTPSGHFADVEVLPVGIDALDCQETLEQSEVKERIVHLKSLFQGKKVIFSRDRVEYTKGIPLKLQAFEAFLEAHPEWREKVVLFQECRPSSSFDPDHPNVELKTEIERLVGRINGRFGSITYTPVHYTCQELQWGETCALLAIADAGLITPLRDGMNIASHEFVACQSEKMSPLILSEFAGSAHCLSGAILINPWDQLKVVKAICKALAMPDDQKKIRHQHNYAYVASHSSSRWVETFLSNVIKASDNLNPLGMTQSTKRANIHEIVESYKKSKTRIILLDYDGTLTPIVKLPHDATPSKDLVSILRSLSGNNKNRTYVISGRDRGAFNHWLGSLPLGMSCEHGAFFRPWIPDGKIGEWQDVGLNLDLSWKDTIRKLFENYADRVPGSFVEVKEINLTWHYRNADPDFGEHQKNDLILHLRNLSSLPIDILDGKKAVEVRPQGINKGSAVKRILSSEAPDFVLCIGDDTTDEDMFREVQKSDVPTKYTIAVGKKQASFSTYYLQNQPDVVSLLNQIVQCDED